MPRPGVPSSDGYDLIDEDLGAARIDGVLGLGAACIVALCAAGVAGGALWTSFRPAAPASGPVELSVGLGTVRVQQGWMRGGASRAPTEPVELVIPFGDVVPDVPAGLRAAPLLVTVAPADGSMLPQDRPRQLYSRFLSASSTPAEGGLIRRRFRTGTPFEGEDLLIAPPDGRAFSARCLDPAPGNPVAASCIAEMRLDRLDVQVRFSPALLVRWDAVALGLRDRLGG